MSATWTPEQDDHTAFEEAMSVADVSTRALEGRLQKLRLKIATIERCNSEKTRRNHINVCLAMVDYIESMLQTPEVSRWRQKHSEGRGRRHSQQHVLEVKLAFAKDLLADAGVDLEAELAKVYTR